MQIVYSNLYKVLKVELMIYLIILNKRKVAMDLGYFIVHEIVKILCELEEILKRLSQNYNVFHGSENSSLLCFSCYVEKSTTMVHPSNFFNIVYFIVKILVSFNHSIQ